MVDIIWKKSRGNWVYVYNTPNINNITLSHLVCLPNHPRIWKRSVLMELENYSEFLPICDDYEILLRTCCSKYKVVKNNKAQYIQYMNDGGNNFSNIRNAEINRIGPNYIGPMFYDKCEVHSKMKELDAYEDESYIHHQSQIWKRREKYQHKKMNQHINLNYDKQYCILNCAIDNEEVAPCAPSAPVAPCAPVSPLFPEVTKLANISSPLINGTKDEYD
jgi:hypothetical protein